MTNRQLVLILQALELQTQAIVGALAGMMGAPEEAVAVTGKRIAESFKPLYDQAKLLREAEDEPPDKAA